MLFFGKHSEVLPQRSHHQSLNKLPTLQHLAHFFFGELIHFNVFRGIKVLGANVLHSCGEETEGEVVGGGPVGEGAVAVPRGVVAVYVDADRV